VRGTDHARHLWSADRHPGLAAVSADFQSTPIEVEGRSETQGGYRLVRPKEEWHRMAFDRFVGSAYIVLVWGASASALALNDRP
jgi:hypothetical protein